MCFVCCVRRFILVSLNSKHKICSSVCFCTIPLCVLFYLIIICYLTFNSFFFFFFGSFSSVVSFAAFSRPIECCVVSCLGLRTCVWVCVQLYTYVLSPSEYDKMGLYVMRFHYRVWIFRSQCICAVLMCVFFSSFSLIFFLSFFFPVVMCVVWFLLLFMCAPRIMCVSGNLCTMIMIIIIT